MVGVIRPAIRCCTRVGAGYLMGQFKAPKQQICPPARAAPGENEDLDKRLAEDLERLQSKQNNLSDSRYSFKDVANKGDGKQGGLKEAIDQFLIADFFFILFALAWLGVALIERSALQSTFLLDTWLFLWQWLFQPAIGVLMLGALVSGGVGWFREKSNG